MLVVARTFHHGWEAVIDGRAEPLGPTAIGQLGLLVPAGRHTAVLRHREPWFGAGLGLAFATVLACLLAISRMRGDETRSGVRTYRRRELNRAAPGRGDDLIGARTRC